jgi:hypothetical protein
VFQIVKLLLPILIPSWRFFNRIAPSPRIEFALLTSAQEEASNWREFCLRPKRLSIASSLKSIFFNPRWNEFLYTVGCAERLIINPTEHCIQEIMQRIKTELERRRVDLGMTPYLQFRLIFVSRQDHDLQNDILFVSKIKRIVGDLEL